MIVIPYASHHLVTLGGTVVKEVRCEGCPRVYRYQMARTARGSGTNLLFLDDLGARGRAEGKARAKLERALDRGCDAVPCPACGRYQARMIPIARREHARRLEDAGVASLIGMVALLFASWIGHLQSATGRVPGWATPSALAGAVACGVAAGGLLSARWARSLGHDPNATDPEKRLEIARRRATLG